MNESEMHYEDCVTWFVYWILELGPKRVYSDVNEILNTELIERVNEGTWSGKQLLDFIEQVESYTREEA